MGRKRFPFYDKLQMDSTGAATEDLYDEVVSAGARRVYTHIQVVNEDTAYTSLEMLSGAQGAEQEFDYTGNPQAGERIEFDGEPVHVAEYERLGFRFTGVTSGDNLIVRLRGYEEVQNV